MSKAGAFTGTEVIESAYNGQHTYWLRSPKGEYQVVTAEQVGRLYLAYERKVVYNSLDFGEPENGNILRIYSLGNQTAELRGPAI